MYFNIATPNFYSNRNTYLVPGIRPLVVRENLRKWLCLGKPNPGTSHYNINPKIIP
jgi:hypothetical protein